MGYNLNVSNEENPEFEVPQISGGTIAAWRQIYRMAQQGAEGFNLNSIPQEYLKIFQAEDDSPPDFNGST